MPIPTFSRSAASLCRSSFVFGLCFVSWISSAAAQDAGTPVGPFRTQSIELKSGWNAVYLEVEPLDTNPAALFEGTPVEIVAAYFRPSTSLEFIDSPSQLIGDRKGWSVWYAPERDDALLSTLNSLQAHRAYLIYTEADFTWNCSGSPYFDQVQWYANAYCLVGFPVDAANAPTVQNFFAGAAAHQPLKIYRMVNGRWALISDPAATLMEKGRAYWAKSYGASEFSGPFRVEFSGSASGGLIYNESTKARRLILRNVSSYPQEITLTVEAGATGKIPMAYVITALNASENVIDKISIPMPEVLTIPSIEPGAAVALDLEVVHEQVSDALLGSNIVIRSDAGLRVDVPVISIRRDLANP